MAEDKVTLSEVGIGINAFVGLTSSFVGFYSSWQTSSSYKSQSNAVLNEAKIQVAVEDYNRRLANEAYGVERINMLKAQERRLSAYNVGYVASGIEMTGSALSVMGEQGRLDSIDLAQLDRNADRAAMQSQMNSISIMSKAKYESKALKRLAHSSKVAGAINLFGGLLGTAGSAAYQFGTVK